MLLNVQELSVEFSTEQGTLKAVDNISFSVNEASTTAIVGESGCGKSVTALSLMRLLPRQGKRVGGKIEFLGTDLVSLSEEQMRSVRGRQMAMIFQEPMTALNPVFTVGLQIEEVFCAHPHISTGSSRKKTLELLEWVGIPDPEMRYRDYPFQLSGGMRQRIMIAMALACRPKLLIADEPTTALDVTIQAQILELIQRLQKEMGMAVILITHDLGVVAEMADDVVVMYAAKVVEKAPVHSLFENPMHPYTRALMESVPKLERVGEKHRLTAIRGMVPNLLTIPSGCRFEPRCPIRQPHCLLREPPLDEKKTQHFASCFET